MIFNDTPPSGWDTRIAFPLQSVGFAAASRALGYRPRYVETADGLALVLVRRVPIPVLAGWTGRAKVYAHADHERFLPALIDALRALGVSHVKVGDSVWGPSGAMPAEWPAMRPVTYHVLAHDLTVDESVALARCARIIRRHLRRRADEVTVTDVKSPEDLRDYVALAAETGRRMRGRAIAAVHPPAYFATILREMVPRGQATMLLARADGAPLAAATFVRNAERFAQVHGCSTRDRRLTPKHGPTFVAWHAMRRARALGCRVFDLGAVTPGDDPAHPHHSVYEYKKRWGGILTALHAGELVVSPWKHRLQESWLAPMWDRVHPVYLRVFAERSRRSTPPGLTLTGEPRP